MILFLDFDGVLHPLHRRETFTRMALLDALLADFPDIEIALTTSWRQIYPLEALRMLLSPTIASRVISLTPSFPPGHIRDPAHPACPAREYECRVWLQANGRESEPWLALDDDPDAFSTTAPVVWCDGRIGLSEEQIAQIRRWIEVYG